MPSFPKFPHSDIAYPHPHDVLSGRGAGISKHPGNQRWRELISDNISDYVAMQRSKRPTITCSIVQAVRSLSPPGRFLAKDKRTGKWYDIGDDQANLKTAQALRDTKKQGENKALSLSTISPLTNPVSIRDFVHGCDTSETVATPTNTPASPIESVPAVTCSPSIPKPFMMGRANTDNTFDQRMECFTFAVPQDDDMSSSCGSISTLPDADLEELENSCCMPTTLLQFDWCDILSDHNAPYLQENELDIEEEYASAFDDSATFAFLISRQKQYFEELVQEQ
jgi:hypothetical protein